jgi:hypothetical protein
LAHIPSVQRKMAAPQNEAAQRKLSLVYRPIADLRPDPSNPRVHSRRQIRQIARSIKAFGFNTPILINAQG